MRVVVVPCLRDNYAYLLVDDRNQAIIIDPSESIPLLRAIEAQEVTPTAIWCTHHHPDHTGGIPGLLKQFPGLEVAGHELDRGRIPAQTTFLRDRDPLSAGNALARVIHNPGHTRGAISFYFSSENTVFTGDTLFLAGCGRLFEGDGQTMHNSLTQLAALPGETLIYCGHEYTHDNLRFALAVQPKNQLVIDRFENLGKTPGQRTMPGTIAVERETNPFLRTHVEEVIASVHAEEQVGSKAGADVFSALRRWKNRF